MQRYSNACVDVKIMHTCMYSTHWKVARKPHPPVGLQVWSPQSFLHTLSCVIMVYQQVKAERRCRCQLSNHIHPFWVWPLTQKIKQWPFQNYLLTVDGWKPYNLSFCYFMSLLLLIHAAWERNSFVSDWTRWKLAPESLSLFWKSTFHYVFHIWITPSSNNVHNKNEVCWCLKLPQTSALPPTQYEMCKTIIAFIADTAWWNNTFSDTYAIWPAPVCVSESLS